MSLVFCVVQLNFHVHDSVAISSADTGTKSATHLLFSYHESGSQYQSYLKGKRKCFRALPNHWLPAENH